MYNNKLMYMKNFYLSVLTLCVMLFAVPAIAQNVFHVNMSNGNDSNDGLQWSSAFKNIQPAIDMAEEGDSILIAEGVYHPTDKIAEEYGHGNTNPTNERHRSFLIKKDIRLFGGFPANATSATTVNDRDWEKYKTVLSGDFNGDDDDQFENTEENALHVVVLLDATSSMRLDGFYIMGGNASGDSAAVYVDNTIVFRDCGGGICAVSYLDESSPTLANLVIMDNQAERNGGGFYNFIETGEASPKLTNVTMLHNNAVERGGAFCNHGMNADPELTRVNITGNSATYDGGGFFCYAEITTAPTLANVLISGNKARSGAGAFIIAVTEYALPTIVNTTVCGNKASGSAFYPEGGGGVLISAQVRSANPHIRNSVFWGNKADNRMSNLIIEGQFGTNIEYANNLVEGQTLNGTNLSGDTDPMFINPVDADLAPTLTEFGDYRLLPESPLIDKGQNSFMLFDEDLDGNTRIFGEFVDIGAYEFQDDDSGNEPIPTDKTIWSHRGDLYVKINNNATTVCVYSVNGMLVMKINNLNEGVNTISTLPNDFYIITLSTGETAKIFIR
jgi:hypothetical protein